MQVSRAVISDMFHLPVGCPFPKKGVSISEHAANWLNSEGKEVSTPQKISYGTYAGIATVVLGAIVGFLGLKNDNPISKALGVALAAIGATIAFVGKFFGHDQALFNKLQKELIFRPDKKINEAAIEENGISKNHEVLIDVPNSDGAKLHGYFVPSPKPTNKVVLYLHGRAHNNGDSVVACKKIQEHVPVNVLMADYRGFGKSAGEASHESVIEDAKAMYSYLLDQGYKPEDVTVYGHSLGGAIGIELAAQLKGKVKNLIVQSSFASFEDIADDFMKKYVPGFVGNTIKRILPEAFVSKQTIKKLHPDTKLLILHGSDDEIIATKQAAELFDSARVRNKQFYVLHGAHHSDFYEHIDEHSAKALREFIGV
ncbi:MAG: alpha/beta hydrolase [Candidatus Melainabacteria bacterium]|nr:alpha/beta hydrolase [Candidatus Melainabacteria bacterium]MBI3309038.1 alpha/beta hydrolase [Candidatus Melainabacteria bacterium]